MSQMPRPELTPVDDVRRIRERLSREAGGNIRHLAAQSQAFFEAHQHEINLRLIPAPPPNPALRQRAEGRSP
jgi:hypothetical protein